MLIDSRDISGFRSCHLPNNRVWHIVMLNRRHLIRQRAVICAHEGARDNHELVLLYWGELVRADQTFLRTDQLLKLNIIHISI